jgi:hypothetical protein
MMLETEHNLLLWRKAEAKIHKIVTNSLQLEFSKDEDKEMTNLVADLIKLPLQEEDSEKLVEQIVIEASNNKSKYLKPIISKPDTIPIKESIIECVKEFCSNIENKEVHHTLTNIKTINKLSDFISQNILTTIYDKLVKIISHYGTLPLISKIIGYLSYSPDTGDIEDYDKLISKEDGLQLQSYNNILDFFSEVELEIDYEQKLTGEND